MSLHLVPADEEDRLVAVRRLDALGPDRHEVLDRIVELTARLLDMPMAAVSIVDHDKVRCVALSGFDLETVDRATSLCSAVIHDRRIFVVPDATRDPRVASSPMVTGAFGLRFYAGAPLMSADGHRVGSLCVMDQRPRELPDGDLKTLESLAAIATEVLRWHESAGADRMERGAEPLGVAELSWEPPPPPKARSAEDWDPLLAAVALRPGQWAKLRHYDGETSAYRAARQLGARTDLPPGHWEFVARRADEGSDLFARVTGEEDRPT